ncbi:hypothetical protein QVM69_33695, partial [Pseudomonas aeruginosa]
PPPPAFTDPATPELDPQEAKLALPDALPIWGVQAGVLPLDSAGRPADSFSTSNRHHAEHNSEPDSAVCPHYRVLIESGA